MYYHAVFLSDNRSLDQEPVHIYFAGFLPRHKEIVTKVLTLVVDEALRTSSTTKTQFVLQLFAEINLFFYFSVYFAESAILSKILLSTAFP